MNADYMLACGIAWLGMRDPKAGWRLVQALESADSQVRALAQALLVEASEDSLLMLESARAAGVLNVEASSSCIAEILRNRQVKFADPSQRVTVGKEICGEGEDLTSTSQSGIRRTTGTKLESDTDPGKAA